MAQSMAQMQMMRNPRMSGVVRKLAEKMHAEMMGGGASVARKRKRKRVGGPPAYRGKR